MDVAGRTVPPYGPTTTTTTTAHEPEESSKHTLEMSLQQDGHNRMVTSALSAERGSGMSHVGMIDAPKNNNNKNTHNKDKWPRALK